MPYGVRVTLLYSPAPLAVSGPPLTFKAALRGDSEMMDREGPSLAQYSLLQDRHLIIFDANVSLKTDVIFCTCAQKTQ